MISEIDSAHFIASEARELTLAVRLSALLDSTIYFALLGLIMLTSLPYGTAEAWWKAVFVFLVFATALLGIVEGLLRGSWQIRGGAVLLPIISLAVFGLLQTVPFQTSPTSRVPYSFWHAVSADPYATRFFVLQMLGLAVAGALLFRYAQGERRTRTLIHVIIGVAVASAIYALLRQTTQHSLGFGLPLIRPDQGYGQFVNKNHFAFLMEMAFGLGLGVILGGGVRRERAMIYIASLLPVWTALVLSNSRGGLLAMLAQVTLGALLLGVVSPRSEAGASSRLRFARALPVRLVLLAALIVGIGFGTVWMGGDRLVSNIEAATSEFDPAVIAMRDGASRREIWRATWRMFADHPIAGVGLGGYWASVPTYHDASGSLTPQEAHNDYLELLASGGLIGFAIGMWFFLLLGRRIRSNLQAQDNFRRAACFGATIAITGVAVHSLVDFGLHMMVNALFFMALIVIATSRQMDSAVKL